jgi:FixJ family two-component response regulator
LAQTFLVSIVDDDTSVLEATASLLESYGYATAAFTSAQEFLQSPRVVDTTCLVTDVRMPGVSGIELQDRLINSGHEIPTIVISAHGDEHVREAALKRGALAFLTKPVTADRLIACLKNALAARDAAVAAP